MGMGDDHSVHIDQSRNGHRQGHERIAQVAHGRAGEAGIGALVRHHRVDQESSACVVDLHGRIADLKNPIASALRLRQGLGDGP
ncbi:hypothetical protein D3C71_866580 [compost metagenome]